MERKLPDGWEWRKMGDICEINPSISRPANFSSETCISFIPMASVDDWSGEIISAEARPIGEIWNGYKRFAEGDVLFARITPCMENGKAAIATGLLNGLGTGSTEFHVLRPKKVVLAKWIHYFVRRDGFLKEAAKGMTGTAGQQRLPKSFLENSSIPLPPLETQRRIVAILDKAEETRRLRVQADKLFREMPLNIFIEIFGDLSKNPNLWEIKKMDEVAEKITDGEHATPIREHEGIYLLSARNIQNHDIALEDVDFIGTEEYERISKRIIPEREDILVSCSGTIGRVARVKGNFKFQMVRSVALIRPSKNLINPIFLEYLFDTNFMKNQIERSVNQSSQANLFQGKIQKLLVPIPPMDIQSRYANIIEKIESMKMRMTESNNNINSLLDNVLQRAFNGELIS